MAVLFFVLAFLIARTQEDVVGAVRARLLAIRTATGILVILIGAWLLALAAWAEFFADVFPV